MGKKKKENLDSSYYGEGNAFPEPPTRPAPVAAPAKGPIQLQPIVQPIALVPYSTKDQAINQYDEGFDTYENELEEDDTYNEKRLNVPKLIAFILGIITIALLVVAKFLKTESIQNYICMQNYKSGLDIILGITGVFGSGQGIKVIIATVALTLSAAFIAILTIISIFGMKKRTPVFSKVIASIALVGMIAFAVIGLIEKNINLGGYIAAGLTLLITIFTLAGRRA